MKKVRLGLIGCGSFAKGMHIPNLKKNKRYQIQAAMDLSMEAAETMAKDVGAEYGTDSLDKILGDDNVDAVLITTRHDSHEELTVKAAQAGKHVLCEKPMALNVKEVKAITAAVKKAGIKYTVGYNRGLSPLITKAKKLLENWDKKIMIYHRIQAPFPADNWTHDPLVGGGRFIGEGCHIFDLICELMRTHPVSVYAAGGTFLDPDLVKIPDSAVITITFADGSVGTTLISSAGCDTFEKEATEIYCDNKAVNIQNFQKMDCYGFDNAEKENLKLDSVDKGHMIELNLFADAVLNNTEAPIGLEQAARAAVISYKVMESLKTGKPVQIKEKDFQI